LTTYYDLLELCQRNIIKVEACPNSIQEKLFYFWRTFFHAFWNYSLLLPSNGPILQVMEEQIALGGAIIEDAWVVEKMHVGPLGSNLLALKSKRDNTRAEISVPSFFLKGYKQRALKDKLMKEMEIKCCILEESLQSMRSPATSLK
jgi:hypothetical protein